jgi:dipeptidyl aminopeptidase/acylaminoacyl peptidase
VARQELKLAGLRLDQEQRSRSRLSHYTSLELVPSTASVPVPAGAVVQGAVKITNLPKNALINLVTWSPDGRRVAFTVRSAGGVGDPPRHPLQLWVADAATGEARPLLGTGEAVEPSAVEAARAAAEAAGAGGGGTAASSAPSKPRPLCPYPTPGLNTVFDSYSWVDSDTIVACVIPPHQGPCPRRPPLPPGPKVQDNSSGRRAQSRTYADLLTDAHDAAVLEHVSSSELLEVDVGTGKWAPLAPVVSGGGEGGAATTTTATAAAAAATTTAAATTSEGEGDVEAPPAPKHPPPRMYTEVDPSPDGRFLLVSWIERPFSYAVPCGRFPARVELWKRGLRGDSAAREDAAALAAAAAAGNAVRAGTKAKGLAPDAVEEAVLSARAEADAQARLAFRRGEELGAAQAGTAAPPSSSPPALPPLPPPTPARLIREVAYLPLAEDIPIAFNAVRKGPRAIGWRDDRPCELAWIECRDGGDPEVGVSPRDELFALGAEEAAAAAAAAAASNTGGEEQARPRLVAQTDLRCGGVSWGDGGLALLYESWWKTRTSRVWMIAPGEGGGQRGASASASSSPSSSSSSSSNPQPAKKTLLFDRNYEDAYGDPGSPLSRRTALGTYVLARLGGKRRLLMTGGGASPTGARPFVDLLDLEGEDSSKWRRVRLWRSQPPYLESLGSVMSDGDPEEPIELDGLRVLLSRETQRDPPQTWLRTFFLGGSGGGSGDADSKTDALLALAVPATEEDGAPPASASSSSNGNASGAAPELPLFTLPPSAVAGAADASSSPSPQPTLAWRERQVTFYPHPHPTLRDVQKEVVRYKRRLDGLELTGTLYLPPGYNKERDGPLPCLMFAYPREFVSKETAGQNRRSPYAFAGVGSQSPTLWLARGYCVLDGPAFPIVAEKPGDEPNDTFIAQLVSNAQAAVAEVVRRGVADPRKVSIGGHSYGAFMSANLAVHAPAGLFAAVIARSGAYNRTLTPFSFQSEERTFWQAPQVYGAMSPFNHADKAKVPILLIHGEEDPNPGTKVIQSERFYDALKGHGKPARLVVLPFEKHSYSARESVLHALAEQDRWMEAHAGYGRLFDGDEDLEGGGASGSLSASDLE